MRVLSGVLIKSLVKTFYQANAGFFLVVVFMGFGFLKTPQHLDIATSLAYHPVFYLIVFIIWGLYAIKTLRFCKLQRRLAAFQFISYIQVLSRSKRMLLAVLLQVGLLLPVLAYSTMLAAVAAGQGQWLSFAIVTIGNLGILLLAAFRLEKIMTQPVDPSEMSLLGSWTNKLPKTLAMMFIHHLFNRQAMLLLGTKIFSLAMVIGFVLIFEMEGTDLRLVSLGLLLSAGINSLLAFHYRQFEQEHMRLFRNLSLSADKRFAQILVTFLILSSPEILVLYVNGVLNMPLGFLLSNALLPVALLGFFHAWCYFRPVDAEQFAKVPFFSVAILFFVILGHVQVLYIALAILAISWLLYRRYFPAFEWAHED